MPCVGTVWANRLPPFPLCDRTPTLRVELDGRCGVSSSERMRILATMQSHQRLIIPVDAAFVLIVAGLSLVWGFGGTMAAAPSSRVALAPSDVQASHDMQATA